MGEDATETLSEIEAARQRLQRDIDVLEDRLRPTSRLRGQAWLAGALTAAVSVVALAVVVSRRRRRRG